MLFISFKTWFTRHEQLLNSHFNISQLQCNLMQHESTESFVSFVISFRDKNVFSYYSRYSSALMTTTNITNARMNDAGKELTCKEINEKTVSRNKKKDYSLDLLLMWLLHFMCKNDFKRSIVSRHPFAKQHKTIFGMEVKCVWSVCCWWLILH